MQTTPVSILCVDDEPRMRVGLQLTLRRGFNVVTAKSGAQGLAVLQQILGSFDERVMDVLNA
jgi:CheY-like chemotaxis protein